MLLECIDLDSSAAECAAPAGARRCPQAGSGSPVGGGLRRAQEIQKLYGYALTRCAAWLAHLLLMLLAV